MNVLITAGGTVAPIDDVRVISNRSTGRFAASLAEAWLRRGASVTYLATTPRTFGPLEIPAMRVEGPVDPHELRRRTMQAITNAWHFDGRLQRVDLQAGTVHDYATELERLCRSRRWDVVMLAAAVSDYEPVPFAGKLDSEPEEIVITLKRTPKVIRQVRDWIGGSTHLTGFKLTSGADDTALESIARQACRSNRADMTIANDQSSVLAGKHRVALVRPEGPAEWFEAGDDLGDRVVRRLAELRNES